MKNFSSTPLTSMSSQLLRLRQQARRRGMSLVEILIVIAIMAMIGGGVAVFAIPKLQEARVKTAEGSARELRKSVALWQTTEGESGCPTVKHLVQSKQIDSASKLEDPWGQK